MKKRMSNRGKPRTLGRGGRVLAGKERIFRDERNATGDQNLGGGGNTKGVEGATNKEEYEASQEKKQEESTYLIKGEGSNALGCIENSSGRRAREGIRSTTREQ